MGAIESYYMGLDWGIANERTHVSIFNSSGKEVHRETFAGQGWAEQHGRITQLYNLYRPRIILAESNSIGVVNIEAFQQEGLPVRGFAVTKITKQALLDELKRCIVSGETQLGNAIDSEVMAIALGLWARRYYSGENIHFA